MKLNNKLSISIPTFNRADFLDEFFKINIPIISQYGISIHISDNSSTDNTKKIIEKWELIYKKIYYSCNSVNVGMDRNFEAALRSPVSDYVWLMGDTYVLSKELVDEVYFYLNNGKNYDAIIINLDGRVKDISTQDYSDCNVLLGDLGWHITCLSCSILKKDIINKGKYSRYYNTDLVHVGVFFEYIADKKFLIKWLANSSIGVSINKLKVKNSWSANTFEIWVKKWPNLIYSLPPIYELSKKYQCIMNHGNKSRLFSLVGLINLRSRGVLNYKNYFTYKDYFPAVINVPNSIIFLVSILPSSPLKLLRIIYLSYKRN